ncbi:MAG: hypothetical protein WCX84_05495 [Syntrophales bacterium]|jgi:hypothetical protein|nr:hypothetical protein [Syntrophales bacterium]
MKKTEKIIFYTPGGESFGSRIKRLIELHFSKDIIMHVKTVKEFVSALKKVLSGRGVVIALCATKNELEELISLRDLLLRHQLILVLPDNEAETLSMGHSLRPRFTTFMEDDLMELSAVLCRMILKDFFRRNRP